MSESYSWQKGSRGFLTAREQRSESNALERAIAIMRSRNKIQFTKLYFATIGGKSFIALPIHAGTVLPQQGI